MRKNKNNANYPTWADELRRDGVFRTAFESSRAVMFLLDPADGSIIGANPAACEFYGYNPEEVHGVSPDQVSLLPPDRLRDLLQTLKSGGGVRFSTRHKLKSGQLRDMEMDAAPITLQSGRTCLFFIGHDVSSRKHAEQSLSQRESLLRAIFDSAGDGIAFRDAKGVYREVNPAFCRMVGMQPDQVLGNADADFYERRSRITSVNGDRRSRSRLEPATYDLTIETKNGPRSISVHKAPVHDASGEFLGVVSISRDTTRRRKAEASLRKSEGLLRAMLQSAQDCIFVTDENDIVRELNQTFCQHMGRPREELENRPLDQIFSGETLRIQLSTNALAREAREPVSFTQHLRPGDEDLWVSVVKSAVVDPEGHVLGVVAMGRDTTAQRNAEHALRQSESRFSGLIRQAPVGVFETDAKGDLMFANERLLRLTGRNMAQLKDEGWLDCVLPADREDLLPLWRTALENKRELEREVRVSGPGGKALWVSLRIRPMNDSDNHFSGYLGVVGDISERKKAEALRADVESVVRHDLKSPIGSMQNAMELLELLGPLTPEQAQVLAEVRSLTRRMQNLVGLSLDLHAIELGAFHPRLMPVDLRPILAGLGTELRPLIQGKGLCLAVHPAEGGPFVMQAEPRLLEAVFSNLLKNAAEAAPEGGEIVIDLGREGDWAVVQVINPGEVPPEMRDRFFDKYATAGKAHGTGLGTYSARLMTRTMGGQITLDTGEPGRTTLCVRLPTSPPLPDDYVA